MIRGAPWGAAQKTEEASGHRHLFGNMEFDLRLDLRMVAAERRTHDPIFWVIPNSRQSTTQSRSSFMQGRESMKTQILYLGIDVSKSKLHLAAPHTFLGVFDNTVPGIAKLIEAVRQQAPQGIILEASGGYERLVCEAMQDAGLSVTVAQPGCIKHFAKSLKVLAKTDRIDAQVIARFGQATTPPPTPKTPENQRTFRALVDRRQQVVDDRVRESNRLETCADTRMRQHIQDQLMHLQELETQLDEQILRQIEADTPLAEKAQTLTQLKGVGTKTAVVLLAHFPELGSLDRQQVAALAGVAPHANESGRWKGKRRINGGRAAVRKAMYMAAKSAARWCPVISEFYNRLRAGGKSYNLALIACARKMLIRLNTLLKKIQPQPPLPRGTQPT